MTETAAEITPQTLPQGWEGILDAGERIVWQGRPDQGFHTGLGKLPVAVFGLGFAGLATFWMAMAARTGGVFWMFGLIHFAVGVGMIWTSVFADTFRRRRTWYTLSDRRAFIATDMPLKGKRLQSYPITPDTPVDYNAGPLATIHFARERRTGSKGRRYTVRIGFERIAEGDKVIGLLRAAQKQEGAA